MVEIPITRCGLSSISKSTLICVNKWARFPHLDYLFHILAVDNSSYSLICRISPWIWYIIHDIVKSYKILFANMGSLNGPIVFEILRRTWQSNWCFVQNFKTFGWLKFKSYTNSISRDLSSRWVAMEHKNIRNIYWSTFDLRSMFSLRWLCQSKLRPIPE